MSRQEVAGFAREVRRRGATLESLQSAVPPEQPQLSSTSRKVTWTSPYSSSPSSSTSSPYSYWTHCYSMGTMLLCVICLEGQHLRDEILYTIVHYIFSVHSVEMDEQDETHNNWTLLHHCAVCGNDRLANILIGRGADVNAQNSLRWTPLHWAVFNNNINVVKVMLSHDSDGVTLDTTLRDSEGRTALDLARQRKHEGCVQLLVDHESAKVCTVDLTVSD
ncbi:espin-like protein [Sycon ciliatum]|uniref:espin-like protein n=1 Tax=Sycon ciliatum TaxID=27933 RepID=UPI0031F6C333